MAKAKPESTSPPAGDEWSIDDAFQYLTHTVGLPPGSAIGTLRRELQDGAKLTATCQGFVNGKLVSTGEVKASFWVHTLNIELAEGRAMVVPIAAVDPTYEYRYTLPANAVRALQPRKKQSTTVKKGGGKSPHDLEVLFAETIKRLEANGSPVNNSAFTNDLLDWHQNKFPKKNAPPFDTLRPHVRRWIEAWHRSN
jgi:hypothetical protein